MNRVELATNRRLQIIGLLLVTYVVYLPSLFVGYHYDDLGVIARNPELSGGLLRALLEFRFRPATGLSYFVGVLFGGAGVQHAINLALHLVNVVLVHSCALILAGPADEARDEKNKRPITALFAAGFFALHPAWSQAVIYPTGRSDLLVTTFLLLAALFILNKPNPKHVLGGALAAGLAMASKETAAPFVLLFFAAVVANGSRRKGGDGLIAAIRNGGWAFLVLLLLLIAALVYRLVIIENGTTTTLRGPLAQLPFAAIGLGHYAGLLLAPLDLSIVRNPVLFVSENVPQLIVGLAVGAAAVFGAVEKQPLRLPILWIACALVLSLMVPLQELVVERRLYPAAPGIAWLFGIGAARLMTAGRPAVAKARLKIAVATLLLAIGMFGTVHHCYLWLDEARLWHRAAEVADRYFVAQFHYGRMLLERGRFNEAAPRLHYARDLNPGHWQNWYLFAVALHESGRPAAAIAELQRAVVRFPGNKDIRRLRDELMGEAP